MRNSKKKAWQILQGKKNKYFTSPSIWRHDSLSVKYSKLRTQSLQMTRPAMLLEIASILEKQKSWLIVSITKNDVWLYSNLYSVAETNPKLNIVALKFEWLPEENILTSNLRWIAALKGLEIYRDQNNYSLLLDSRYRMSKT